jgi:ABC-type antimicrobial peptide transport system permease subunit
MTLLSGREFTRLKDPIPPVFFMPYRQSTQLGSLTFYVRTARDPDAVMATIPPLINRIDATLPVENLRTLTEQVRANVFLDRFVTTLSTAFAGLATLLAAVGLYGVLAYMVAQRTREIGLRMALGATPAIVRRMVLRQVVWMTIVGGVIGLGLAALAGWGAGSLLYEVKGYDPLVLTLSAMVLAVVALSAGFFPALRASRVDPMRALRYE